MKLLAPAIVIAMIFSATQNLSAHHTDPCGMVPPIYTGNVVPITRKGLQKTYVFYKDGIETFVIRPGFQGKVDNFGMLIPFPSAPAIRKVSDNVFQHVANSIDPPEVVVDLRPMVRFRGMRRAAGAAGGGLELKSKALAKDEVRVVKQEAVGMYEVAVLEAGSSAALKKWMEQHKYVYPKGMDKTCDEYIEARWCFVAVKSKVGPKAGVDPTPGQRKVRPNMPKSSTFDGHVQGMGFRFKTDELVVPMRLSTFNGDDTRNIVYLLTDGPKKIRSIPEEFVQRQLTGKQLIANLTQPLPVRIINGTEEEFKKMYGPVAGDKKAIRGSRIAPGGRIVRPIYSPEALKQRRNPKPHMQAALELFAGDMIAVESKTMSLVHEEAEKELLRIGEHFGLRGNQFDKAIAESLNIKRDETVKKGLKMLEKMTMTVVDGDFPREVLSSRNLKFAEYQMPSKRNRRRNYDAKEFGPSKKKGGILKVGAIDWNTTNTETRHASKTNWLQYALLGIGIVAFGGVFYWRRSRRMVVAAVAMAVLFAGSSAFAQEDLKSIDDIVAALKDSKTSSAAIQASVAYAKKDDKSRDAIVTRLVSVAKTDKELSRRGWAIAALAAIGGQDVDEHLLGIHDDAKQKKVVRDWAAAARVQMTRTLPGLLEKAQLIQKFPALGRPIGMRIVDMMADSKDASAGDVLKVTLRVPQLRQALAPSILAFGPKKLAKAMLTHDDTNVRRQAAAYLGTLAQQGQSKEVVKQVVEMTKFDAQADETPWAGGGNALFIPGIRWGKEDARALVGNLIRWHLWADINKEDKAKAQIHNNIRSLGLARAAGYQSPGWNNVGTKQWLIAWGKCVGKDELKKILEEQGVEGKDQYASVLKDL